MAEMVKEIMRRAETAKARRNLFDQHYEDLARVFAPRQQGFVTTFPEGEQRNDDIYDGSAMQAARGLANAIGSIIRPDGGDPWVRMRAADDDIDNMEEAQDWLEDATHRLMGAISNPKSRSRHALGETDFSLVVFGEAPLFIDQSVGGRHLIFQATPLRRTFVIFDEYGAPHGVFFYRNLTLSQAKEKFGAEALSQTSQKKLSEGAKNLDDKVEFLHAILPRKEGFAGALFARNLPIADLWIETGEEHIVQRGGYHEFPFVVPRWDTTSGEDHGRGPGMIALPDGNTLQAMGETILVAGQRAADPALMIPNDGIIDIMNTLPGGLSYYDVEIAKMVGGNPIFPLDTKMNLPITLEMQQDRRELVFNAFFRHVLNLPIDRHNMTATEVMQRKEEFIREIGPVFGRLETDYTAPMVERCFNIMLRAEAFKPVPDVLAGRRVVFEYESPIKRIREEIQSMQAQEWVVEMLKLAEAKPEAADLVNMEEYGRLSARAKGVPTDIINDRETTAAAAQGRAQAQQQMAQVAQAQQVAEVADQGAGAMQKMMQQPAAANAA